MSFERPSYSLRAALLGAVALAALGGVAVETSVAPVSAAATTAQAAATTAQAPAVQAPAGPASFADVVDRVKPAVVSVKVKLTDADPVDDEDLTGSRECPTFPRTALSTISSAISACRTAMTAPIVATMRRAIISRRLKDRDSSFRRRLYRHQQPCRRSCLGGDRHDGRGQVDVG